MQWDVAVEPRGCLHLTLCSQPFFGHVDAKQMYISAKTVHHEDASAVGIVFFAFQSEVRLAAFIDAELQPCTVVYGCLFCAQTVFVESIMFANVCDGLCMLLVSCHSDFVSGRLKYKSLRTLGLIK